MISKRVALSAALASALILAGCGGGEPAATESTEPQPTEAQVTQDVTLGLTYIPNVQFSPSYVAADEGFFEREGASVTIRHHGADEGLFTALLAGEEDMVIATGDEMLIARSQGMDLISVGQYYAKYPVSVIVKADSDIQSIEDLKGRKVGLPGEFGSNWYGLLSTLDSYGMSVSDIEVVSIGFTQLPALMSGEVDAVVGFTNNDMVQFSLAGVEARELQMAKEGELPLIGANVVTTSKFAGENPEAVKAVLAGLRAGKQFAVDEVDRTIEITKNYDPNLSAADAQEAAKAILTATNELFQVDGVVTMEQNLDTWAAMNEFLASQPDLLASEVNIAEAVTNDYVK
ncbi:MAG: ABC transporter substrate-binding protein [Actinomycetaceae bacterium]|nr:ABC transporter substrate-binding protein [Actinomycetaceae bacterium]